MGAVFTLCGIAAQIPGIYSVSGALCGYTQRVGQMFEALEELSAGQRKLEDLDKEGADSPATSVPEGMALVLDGVEVTTPAGDVLARDVNMSVPVGSSALIVGPSGCGKTSLLRVIASLWPATSGRVMYANKQIGSGGVLFVPQRPYITQGSLRQQIMCVQGGVTCHYGGG